jgi:hypothetical protein
MGTVKDKVRIDLTHATRRRLAAYARKRETWDEALNRLMDASDRSMEMKDHT